MKVKLFISTSLGLAGLWLAAAYLHTVDISTYTPVATETVQLETEPTTPENEESKDFVASAQ